MGFSLTTQLFVVLGIAVIIWLGLFVYMFAIGRKISKLEKNVK
jgi:CcmD family protein